jgi:hypothetical protein
MTAIRPRECRICFPQQRTLVSHCEGPNCHADRGLWSIDLQTMPGTMLYISVEKFGAFALTCLVIELTPGPNMAYLAVLSRQWPTGRLCRNAWHLSRPVDSWGWCGSGPRRVDFKFAPPLRSPALGWHCLSSVASLGWMARGHRDFSPPLY